MSVKILCFHQDGCPGCAEQKEINLKIQEKLGVTITDIDAIKTEGVIQKYTLKVTPTILILVHDTEKERMEGITPSSILEEKIRKYVWL